MKRFFIFLTAALCSLCLAACTDLPEPEGTEGSEYEMPLESQEGLVPGGSVVLPDDMPDKPEEDYQVPPDNPLRGESS